MVRCLGEKCGSCLEWIMESKRRTFWLLLCNWSVLREQLEKCIKCAAPSRIPKLIFCDITSRWGALLVSSLLKSRVDEIETKQKRQHKKSEDVAERGK